MHKFLVAFVSRLSLDALLHRCEPVNIHIIPPLAVADIPKPVLSFVAKSEKLVPYRKVFSWRRFSKDIDFLFNQHMSSELHLVPAVGCKYEVYCQASVLS